MEAQDNIFARSEGDRWFERNAKALQCFNPTEDTPLKLMQFYGVSPRSVLEIGAANGFRLAEIQRRSGARAVGVELSHQAIADGRARFPLVTFVRGAANSVPLQEVFDLVIVNFVFHWVDRIHLLQSVAETDRLRHTHAPAHARCLGAQGVVEYTAFADQDRAGGDIASALPLDFDGEARDMCTSNRHWAT